MLHASVLASTCFTCFLFKNRDERFIRIVLDVLSEDLRLPIADRCLIDQGRKQPRKHAMVPASLSTDPVVDFIGCAGTVRRFRRERAESSGEMPANGNGGGWATWRCRRAEPGLAISTDPPALVPEIGSSSPQLREMYPPATEHVLKSH
jgi:hypothetical protein